MPRRQAVGRAQRDGAHHAVAELLLHLQGQRRAARSFERVVHASGICVARELHVDDRADALNDLALCHLSILQQYS
jgi:hypothetical protein